MLSNSSARAAVLAAALSCSYFIPAASALPVISEIMYRPGTGFPEDTALEYIEVYNPDPVAADMSGWAFRSGVNFIFPVDTILPAGGYLVVAANPTALQAAYGSLIVFGPWTAGNTLSNNGERITLSRPDGPPGSWTKVDEVIYASEGDWAQRTWSSSAGWDWTTGANGGGKSLELRNPLLSNDNGQNWTASTAPAGGTPGAPNSVATENVPPVIHGVKHSPAVPGTGQTVTISCEVNDEAPPEARTATLFYRNATGTTPPAFTSLAMTNDGSGKLRAVVGPFPTDKTIIEFYVSSGDGNGTRTWPAPTSEGQTANCQFQVDNEVPSATADTYRITMTAAENAAFTGVSSSSDRQFNQTLIVQRGTETEIRYRSAMRIRGNSSRSYQFKPLRINIPGDDGLDGSTRFNLNPKASFLQYLGMKCFEAAGLPAASVIPVELRRNGVEQTTSSGSTPDFGLWVRMEDLSAEMVDAHWPLANSGNIYKKGRPDQYWRSTASAPSNPDGTLDGWSKQNNSSANDWSDMTQFFATVQSISAPHFPGSAPGNSAGAGGSALSGVGYWDGTPYDADEVEVLNNVADTPQWARWFAMMTLLQSNETNISNGQDDDYACYFVPSTAGRRRMQLLPHDLDTILGKGDDASSHGLYDATAEGAVFRPLLPLMGNSVSTGNPEWRTAYHNAIRQYCGTVFSSTTFPSFVEYHLGNWAPANVRAEIVSFMSSRSTALLGSIGAAAITPPPATAASGTTQNHGPLIISEVLAANAAALQRDGVYPDVIEILNTGGAAVDLGGKSISDDPAVPQKFVFAPGTTLNAGAYLLLFADANFAGSGLHTGFSLDQSGDALYLYDTPAAGGTLLDSIVFGPQATDFSIGRTGPGLNTVTLCTPTLGAANTAVAALASPGILRINEWLANPDFRVNDDFIEIHNSGTQPVAMGGMRLTDDVINYPSRHTLPALSFIGPGGFQVFKAKGSSATPGNPSELPFSLDSTFGGAALLGANGTVVDQVSTVSQRRDRSTGRSPDSSSTLTNFDIPSPGLSNSSLPASYQALLNGLRITEVLYKPNGGNDYEFIELQNTGAVSLPLAGVRFTSGVDYTFPAGTSLAPGAFTVICRNRAVFLSRFPNASTVLAPGQFSGALDNSGETITLSLPNPWDVAILNFRYENFWQPLTLNAGYSLTVLDPALVAARDYNESSTWTSSVVPDGTPGSDGPPGITSALTASVIAGDPFSYTITADHGPLLFSATPVPAGLNFNTATGVLSGNPIAAGVYQITIGATNTAGSDSKTLVLTISSSGPLHHFTWENTPSGVEAGRPFPVYISARDAQNRLVTSFSGSVPLSATATGGGTTSSSVYITEVTDENEDQFELQNTGPTPVNTRGWFVMAGNSSGVTTTHAQSWALPDTVAPGEILRVSETNGSPGTSWYGSSISWTQLLNRGWIMLLDNTGAVRDFFVWGWTANDMKDASVTVNTYTVSLASLWSGDGAVIPANRVISPTNSFQRSGSSDHNDASDWNFLSGGATWGTSNANLSLPWQGSITVTYAPPAAAFSGGVFAGFLTVNEAATGVRLTVTDAQLRAGQSAAFTVSAAQADTDGDSMPDAWETANGLDPGSPADAALDSDGDGLTNRTEYYGGTNPRSAASRMAITSWSGNPSGGIVTLSWSAQAGRLYRIRYSTNLASWSYVPGQVHMPQAAGTRITSFVPPAGAEKKAYYQVELLTPP